MKRAVLNHPKLFALMAESGMTRRNAIGLLVLLWDFTGQYAPNGAVGRFTDQAIADAVEWKDQASALIACLVRSGWIDETDDQSARLVVHDWGAGCDQWVKKRLAIMGEPFYTGEVRTVRPGRPTESDIQNGDPEKHSLSLPLSSPNPNPNLDPNPTPRSTRFVYSDSFEQFWKPYPTKAAKLAAFKAWQKMTSEDQDAATASSAEYAGCPLVKIKGVVCHASTWLNGRRWEDEREAWQDNGKPGKVSDAAFERYMKPEGSEQ